MPYILLAMCADVPGISAAVTGFVADCGGFIQDSQQYGDVDTGLFFLRIVFREASGNTLKLGLLRRDFDRVAALFHMRWSISDTAERPRTVLAVSKFGHCVNDLLHRWRSGTLPADVVGVVSNHSDIRALVEWHGLPIIICPFAPGPRANRKRRSWRW